MASPYGFTPEFELAVAALSCTDSEFFGKLGHALDPEAIEGQVARLLVQTALTISREYNNAGPGSAMVTLQRLRRLQGEGKLTRAQVEAAADAFDNVEDMGLDVDQVMSEAVPPVRRRLERDAVQAANEKFASRGTYEGVQALFETASRLGIVDVVSLGTVVGPEAIDEVSKVGSLERLPTGILDLDAVIGGGLWRPAVGCAIGGTGTGKSMFLSQQAAEAQRCGLSVGYATLELGVPLVLARILSNLTGVPIDSISNGSAEKARQLLRKQRLGPCVVNEFTAGATTVKDIVNWADRVTDAHGRPFDLLCIDYADHLGTGKSKDEGEGYHTGGVVYKGLQALAKSHNLWLWTASQPKRSKDGSRKRLIDLDDVADSMHKVRLADLVITLNGGPDATADEVAELTYLVAKYRIGEGRKVVGPLPTDFAVGRMSV